MEEQGATTRRPTADLVALVLASGLSTTLVLLAMAVLYAAIFRDHDELSDNGVQVLLTTLGGAIGILGWQLGYRVGRSHDLAPEGELEPPFSEGPP